MDAQLPFLAKMSSSVEVLCLDGSYELVVEVGDLFVWKANRVNITVA